MINSSSWDYIDLYDTHPFRVRVPTLLGDTYARYHDWCYENVTGTFANLPFKGAHWYYFSDKNDAVMFKLIFGGK